LRSRVDTWYELISHPKCSNVVLGKETSICWYTYHNVSIQCGIVRSVLTEPDKSLLETSPECLGPPRIRPGGSRVETWGARMPVYLTETLLSGLMFCVLSFLRFESSSCGASRTGFGRFAQRNGGGWGVGRSRAICCDKKVHVSKQVRGEREREKRSTNAYLLYL
jgi:hypothetical protein